MTPETSVLFAWCSHVRHPDERVAVRKLRPCRQQATADGVMTRYRQICRKGVVKVPKGIGWKIYGRQKIFKLLQLIRRQGSRRRLQIRECLIKLLQASAIAAPMKRLVSDDILERNCDCRAFHGMKVEHSCVGNTDDGPSRIAKVPGEPIHTRVHMARAARDMTQTGRFVSVVKVLAAGFNYRRRWIEERRCCNHGLG